MTDQTIEEAEDRLPWLESVEEGGPPRAPVWRLALIIVAIAALVAAIVYAGMALQRQRTTDGGGALIQAEKGDYKVKPDDPGGMKVDGDGDTVFATSAGDAANGSVNLGAVPEAPVAGRPAPKAGPTPGATPTARVVTEVPRTAGSLSPKSLPAPALRSVPMSGGGSVVQLGSFPSEATANAAWQSLSARFGYLAPLGKSVQQAEVKGRTVYRLRVNAGSATQAGEICAKLKVAGEPCFIPG